MTFSIKIWKLKITLAFQFERKTKVTKVKRMWR